MYGGYFLFTTCTYMWWSIWFSFHPGISGQVDMAGLDDFFTTINRQKENVIVYYIFRFGGHH